MKRVVNVTEVEGDGLESLLGKKVMIMCCRYSYSGILVGINDDCICLEKPAVVYETGPWSAEKWKDEQPMGVEELFVQKAAIEAFMVGK